SSVKTIKRQRNQKGTGEQAFAPDLGRAIEHPISLPSARLHVWAEQRRLHPRRARRPEVIRGGGGEKWEWRHRAIRSGRRTFVRASGGSTRKTRNFVTIARPFLGGTASWVIHPLEPGSLPTIRALDPSTGSSERPRHAKP